MPGEIRARGGQSRGSMKISDPSATTTAAAASATNNNGTTTKNGVGKKKNINHDTNTNGFDPKHKEAINAKLSDRRRERRQQRLARQGLSTNTKRRRTKLRNRAKMRTLMMIISSICCLCCLWLFGFYCFHQLSSSSSLSSDNNAINSFIKKSHPISMSSMLRRRDIAGSLDRQVLPNTQEMIDMRELNRVLPFDNPDGGAWKQGWDVQPVPLTTDNNNNNQQQQQPLKVFVVPHSHCDPGWIKTFDDYFQSQTKQILTSVVQSLKKNPKRKFIWAEISYFEWWWKEQDSDTQHLVKKLLYDRQFEFVTGGWVQPDEANTQLYAMEIQLQEGHDFIRENFGEEYIPKYGWSIDPFGYSPTMAYLLKKYNFEAMLIQRVHYAIKKELALHKQLEFIWRQTWDNDGVHDIFTHVMPFYSYDVPHTCGPDPSVCCQFDFARLKEVAPNIGGCPWRKPPKIIHDRNVEERSKLLLDQYRKKAALYRSNVVIAPLGDDFRYQSLEEADAQYENYQKIFDYINNNIQGVDIQFGTLSDYFETAMSRLHDAPVLKGSFFTYADRDEDYWSGYFTSRVFDKALDRQLERVLYAATSMGASKLDLQESRRALSLFQHHDGVTGTAKDHVVEDYANRIHKAIRDSQHWMIHNYWKNRVNGVVQPCWQSDAPRGLTDNLCSGSIVVYNPLDTPQSCGEVTVPGLTHAVATLPCENPGSFPNSQADIQFDPQTGLMTHPIKEEWMVWSVKKGGAYLFFPGRLGPYHDIKLDIEQGGYVVRTPNWKRTVVEKKYPDEIGNTAIVLDFEYETFLKVPNEEWLVRFASSSPGIANHGVFHTDLNGYNFDTHHFRSDMPIQSQVFPMPTHASIEDNKQRLTVLSEHAQGTASIEEGTIDVWLDRRLMQDDDRGLGQGVRDNVPTRTRLRVVLEKDGYDHTNPEFKITRLSKLMWKQLNHPLEMFGTTSKGGGGGGGQLQLTESAQKEAIKRRALSSSSSSKFDYVTPLVFMVYNRVDYFKKVIGSLRESDYPRNQKVPIIISHDGHVDEMVEYVEGIKSEFNVIQLFHPYSCSEHPNSFPGDDPSLNKDYNGDTYGNPREGKITCCKHHFTWLLNTVFTLKEVQDAHGFLFMEEDYTVAPTFYETLQTGFAYVTAHSDQYFGVTMDISEGWSYKPQPYRHDKWVAKKFVTGPMAIGRNSFDVIKSHAKDYCTFDDYNWDWSLVHLMYLKILPHMVVVPGSLQVAHIGLEHGLHEAKNEKALMSRAYGELKEFHAKINDDSFITAKALGKMPKKGFGGWGHPVDQDHCMKLFKEGGGGGGSIITGERGGGNNKKKWSLFGR